jgi:hypothetical protein
MSVGAEKRTYQRVGFLCRVDVATGDGTTIGANSVDISLSGVGVAAPRFVAAGRDVTQTFHLRDRAGAPAIEHVDGRVANARAGLDGHLLGVEFHTPLQRSSNPLLTRAVERL